MGAFVYILRCADGSFYVGNATGEDLTRRIAEHQSGAYSGYTWLRRPVTLAWSEYFDRFSDANAAERRLKGWSRAKKEALVASDFQKLRELSKRPGRRPSRPSLRDDSSG